MSNGYFLADTNSLVYAYRAGGAQLLDKYFELADAQRGRLAVTRTVRNEIERGPLKRELLRYIADKGIKVLPAPQTEQLRARKISHKNAGEESIVEVAKRILADD